MQKSINLNTKLLSKVVPRVLQKQLSEKMKIKGVAEILSISYFSSSSDFRLPPFKIRNWGANSKTIYSQCKNRA